MGRNGKLIVVGCLVVLSASLAVYAHTGTANDGVVQQCRSTTHSFDGDAVDLASVHHHERDGRANEYLVNVTVRSEAVDRLVLTSGSTTVANVSTTPGDYTFEPSREEIRSLKITAKGENGTVLDRATVEYRCSSSTAS